jgi:tricorn protease
MIDLFFKSNLIVMRSLFCFLVITLTSHIVHAQVDARLFRFPDVSASHICFVYGGDIWVAPKAGGTASRVTSSTGEESFPRFSPDGKTIAFTATYRGNADVYTMPVGGGVPTRLTWHAMQDRVVDWHPNGNQILFASLRENQVGNVNNLYLLSKNGGLPEKLSLPYGELGSFSPDGENIAYVSRITENYPFKRYRGGLASDVVIFNLKKMTAENITASMATDGKPVWHKNSIYYVSDVDDNKRRNIWVYDITSKKRTQITKFSDMDINHMSAGPDDLIFEAGGKLYLLDLASNKYEEVKINVVTDYATLMPRPENVATRINDGDISPDAKRVVVEARGELFSVPAENGPVLNLTNSSGAFDQFPAWSPNGKWIAYWSDKSGEYELWIQETQTGVDKKLTNIGRGMGFQLFWSPDSKKIAYINDLQEIKVLTVASGEAITIDKTTLLPYPALRGFRLDWSPDNNWITYSKAGDNLNSAIYLYNLPEKKLHKATAGFYNDTYPAFDPSGKYLFFKTDRRLQPIYSNLDGTWIYPNSTQLAYASLDPSAKSLLAPRNDDVKVIDDKEKDTATAKPASPPGDKAAADKGVVTAKAADKPSSKPIVVKPENLEARLEILPVPAGNYADIAVIDGKLLYRRLPNTGSSAGEQPTLYMYEFEKREEKKVLAGTNDFAVSGDGKSILVLQGNNLGIIKPSPEQRIEKPLRTSAMEMNLDPREEWNQLFTDTWRRYRDFFYDPEMQQVNWNKIRKQYGDLMKDAITRWDVLNIQQEMIAELAAGHTYANGGDNEQASNRGHGFLGIDWELANGAYRIKRIVRPAAWDNEVRSPFDLTGSTVKEGDYILAVNGKSIDPKIDPYAAFDGTAGTTVILKVNSKPTLDGAKDVLIETLNTQQERRLRHLEWIEMNRKKVDEISGGKLGYAYMPNTGQNGQTELMRQFYAQIDKEGFIIDERFNAGGQLGDRFIEMLNRPNLYNIAWRNAGISRIPGKGNDGPKAMLINGWAGSGGDAFPWAFKTMNMGPIIGERTLGILVGPATGHGLIDGGGITVPDARLYGPDGKWFAEGYGVTPTIEVWDDPAQLAKGIDPQLMRAIDEVMKLVKSKPRKLAAKPPFEDRSSKGIKEAY